LRIDNGKFGNTQSYITAHTFIAGFPDFICRFRRILSRKASAFVGAFLHLPGLTGRLTARRPVISEWLKAAPQTPP
jgi:hypothetical protein